MPTIVGILTFMSRINVMLSWDEHEKSFIRPEWLLEPSPTSQIWCVKAENALASLFVCKDSSEPLITRYAISTKGVLWKQRMHQRTETTVHIFWARLFWARLASFGHLGLISDPLIVSKFHSETQNLTNLFRIFLDVERSRRSRERLTSSVRVVQWSWNDTRPMEAQNMAYGLPQYLI